MDDFVGRTLTYWNEKGEQARIDDTGLTGFPRPLVILGEPGMGKTRLLRQLEATHGWTFRSAASFVEHPDPARLVEPGKRLIIDGLDELAAAKESDPVYRVLGQLIRAGSPPFVLSCRAADWRGAVARQDISEEYPEGPLELSLDPFSQDNAIAYLTPLLGETRAAETVAYLLDKGLPDLFGNPLTLKLFGEVARQQTVLPKTRAELMKAATAIMWNERNDRHDKSALSSMDEATALAASGAACAAFILAGAEAIALKPSASGVPNLLPIAEIQALPGGDGARVLIGSRLFGPVPGAPDLFKPIHRTVAEYLGARWLASVARDTMVRERVLAMMTVDGGVPASLRGLHAWLAQDGAFAPAVIATDPYGVLRYGDPDGLTVGQGHALLEALQALERRNPYFRAEDWGRHSANGLAQIELLNEVRAVVFDEATGFHLRTLLLGAIRGSALAAALVDDLRAMILNESSRYSYGERHAAVDAMVGLPSDVVEWPAMLKALVAVGGEDATRLALEALEDIGFATMDADFVARAILAYLGLIGDNPGSETERNTFGALYSTATELPDAMIPEVLDAIADRLGPRDIDGDFHEREELADIVTRLIARQLDIAPPPPLDLLDWLRITPGRHGYSREDQLSIEDYLKQNDSVRRTIQRRAIIEEEDHESVWGRIWRLGDHNSALALTSDDIVYFLGVLAAAPDRDETADALWREFASFARRNGEDAAAIIEAARPFAFGDADREAYLLELQQPVPPPEWEVTREARRAAKAAAKATLHAQHREDFTADIDVVRAGELRRIVSIGKVYLARFSDVDKALPPPDRVGDWLGPELQRAGMDGLEAVLHRDDLPTLEQVAQSYAESKRWNYIYPMIAGVVERVLNGRGLDGIKSDVLLSVRIGIDNEHLGDRISQDRVTKAIDEYLRRDQGQFERYIRLLLEPSLKGRNEHVGGLYGLARSEVDRPLAVRLAAEWLQSIEKLPVGVESQLVDILADAGAFEMLRKLCQQYATKGYDSDERRLSWTATGILCDFEQTSERVGKVPAKDKAMLWNLRHRFGGGRGEGRAMPDTTPTQLAWIVASFRKHWPERDRDRGVSSGDHNDWDATDFLRGLINRIASDTSQGAVDALAALSKVTNDGYCAMILHAADLQRKARRELAFPGVPLARLKDAVEHRPPRTSDDLLVVLLHTLRRVQAELRGNDTDSVDKYWGDDGQPRGEDRCTDAFTEDMARLLPDFGIARMPQADMPNGKIADLLYTVGDAALPIEAKGQWNRALWSAAGEQLDAFYVRDWRVQDRGIYLVYWFGPGVAAKSRLKGPPRGTSKPKTPGDLRKALTEAVPPARRGSIHVEVLDLTR